MTGVNEEHTAKTKLSFRKKLLIGLITFFFAVTAWIIWEICAFNNAVQIAKEAGFDWDNENPITLIRKDWRYALIKRTWGDQERKLEIRGVSDLDPYREMLHRLRPKYFTLRDCNELQNVNALESLTSLQFLTFENCPALHNVNGLIGTTSLEVLLLYNCTELKNVDGLKGLTSLNMLDLSGCEKIPSTDLRELRAALPQTNIVFPDGTQRPPH